MNTIRVLTVPLLASAAFAGDSVLTLDAFEDGGVSLTSNGNLVGSETPSSAFGAERVVSFLNGTLDGTLTIDQNEQTLTHDTNGNGEVTLAYGYNLVGEELSPDLANPFNLDLTGFDFLRVNILSNESDSEGLVITFSYNTYDGKEFNMSSELFIAPAGFEGVLDLPIDTIAGDADISDVDSIAVTILNPEPGLGYTIGGLELVNIAPVCAGDCDGNGEVDFDDLVSMLFEFDTDPGNGCDADVSGNVDFNDLVATLFLFGTCP